MSTAPRLPGNGLGKAAEDTPVGWTSATHVGVLNEIFGSWFWGMNQGMKDLFPFLSFCNSHIQIYIRKVLMKGSWELSILMVVILKLPPCMFVVADPAFYGFILFA